MMDQNRTPLEAFLVQVNGESAFIGRFNVDGVFLLRLETL
jgi:hypothetical protein